MPLLTPFFLSHFPSAPPSTPQPPISQVILFIPELVWRSGSATGCITPYADSSQAHQLPGILMPHLIMVRFSRERPQATTDQFPGSPMGISI